MGDLQAQRRRHVPGVHDHKYKSYVVAAMLSVYGLLCVLPRINFLAPILDRFCGTPRIMIVETVPHLLEWGWSHEPPLTVAGNFHTESRLRKNMGGE